MQLPVLNRCGVGGSVIQRGGHSGSENGHSSERSLATALRVFLHFPMNFCTVLNSLCPDVKQKKSVVHTMFYQEPTVKYSHCLMAQIIDRAS